MKELQIIVKTPDDGNPLNLRYGWSPHENGITVGWKLTMEDGQDYGTYYVIPESTTQEEDLANAVRLAFDHAMATKDHLEEGRDEKDAVLPG